MLRNHKAISIVMALVFCMSFIAPLVVVDQAVAASTTTVELSNVVGAAAGQSTGIIKVVIPKTSVALTTGSQVSFSWPSDVLAANNAGLVPSIMSNDAAGIAANAGRVYIMVPNGTSAVTAADLVTGPIANSKFTVTVTGQNGTAAQDLVFYVNFNGMNCTNYAGDINVNVIGEPGSQFTTQPGLVVGTVKKDIGTNTVSKGLVQITSAGGPINTINIFENARGALTDSGITLEIMTNGFTWGTPASLNPILPIYAGATTPFDVCAIGEWGWGDTTIPFNPVAWQPTANPLGNKVMTMASAVMAPRAAWAASGFIGNSTAWANTAAGTPGWIQVGTLAVATASINSLYLQVDESVARPGTDVEVKVKSTNANGGITEQTIVVAKYVDYTVNVVEGTQTEVLAGWSDQELGEFYIEEVAKNTLIVDRTILLTLPEGVRWDVTNLFGATNWEVVNASTIGFQAVAIGNYTDRDPENMNGLNAAAVWVGIDGGRVLKLVINQTSAGAQNGAKIKFKKLKVLVSPSFSGDINVEVSGSAGAKGTAKVAVANPAIEMVAVDETLPDVVLGVENQACSDVTITETKAGALAGQNPKATEGVAANQKQWLRLSVDGAYYSFNTIPTVTVESGDIVLGQPALEGNSTIIAIPIKGASYKEASVIKVSGINVDINRNAPQGALNLRTERVFGNPPATLDATNVTGSFGQERAAITPMANMVTIPPYENEEESPTGTVSATFVVGSSYYTVNGIAKAMDAASYIKDGRTFVPMRYVAYAIGLTEDQIEWEPTAKTVTLTKGDTTVVFTIGSKTYTINGEEKTMDVAPELKGDRAYLPARYVAESFGFTVAWDDIANMVIISN